MSADLPSVLAIIPARGGSKGVPRKNIAPLGGKPLIAWTIEAALAARCVSRTIVSTDSPEIAEAARAAGADVPFLRPDHLASDTATTLDVIAHARQACPGFDVLLVLQPTSPLRQAADIDAAFAQMMASGAESCTSVCEADTPPWLMYRQTETGFVESVLPPWPGGMRRQDLPPVYVLNGALYFVKTTAFDATGQLLPKPTAGYVMPVQTSIDIDTHNDLQRAEVALAACRALDS